MLKKIVKKLSKNCQKVSKSCQKVLKKLSKKFAKICQFFFKKLSNICQNFGFLGKGSGGEEEIEEEAEVWWLPVLKFRIFTFPGGT
jgi:mRNA-degrading endonuclease RelE of RelBE toxin-antitoxin system